MVPTAQSSSLNENLNLLVQNKFLNFFYMLYLNKN